MSRSAVPVCDATLFHNEFEILDFRLKYLEPHVGRFYIAESRRTFSGMERPLVLENYISTLPRKIQEKIHVVEIQFNNVDFNNPWAIEAASRDYLLKYIFRMQNECHVVFSDLDEIPSIEQINEAKAATQPNKIQNIPMRVSYRRANWMVGKRDNLWKYPKLLVLNEFTNSRELENIRETKVASLRGEPGIHLSYMGMDSVSIKEKYQAFSHTEFNSPKFYDGQVIIASNKYCISHLGDARKPGRGILEDISSDSFGSIQAYISKSNPDWISHRNKLPPKFLRVYASIILTMHLEKNNLKSPSFKFKVLRDIGWILEFYVAKTFRLIREII